jgi:hypothetical protein
LGPQHLFLNVLGWNFRKHSFETGAKMKLKRKGKVENEFSYLGFYLK